MSESLPKDNKLCVLCEKQLVTGRKFCSIGCKAKSQELKIDFVCNGCGKVFKNWPYLKRKTNYCTTKCYWKTTRRKETRECKVCNEKFIATGAQVRNGFGFYCSRKCQHIAYPKKVKKICPECKKVFLIPPSWTPVRTFCSKKCQDDSMRDYVSSECRKCGKIFELPRSDLNRGRRNFCTYKCYLMYRGPSTLEEKMERALKLAHISFERETKFKRFHVDFLIRNENLVIECDGEYWHMSSLAQERDRRKDELLKSLGYRVLRFSGRSLGNLSEKQLSQEILGKLNYVL